MKKVILAVSILFIQDCYSQVFQNNNSIQFLAIGISNPLILNRELAQIKKVDIVISDIGLNVTDLFEIKQDDTKNILNVKPQGYVDIPIDTLTYTTIDSIEEMDVSYESTMKLNISKLYTLRLVTEKDTIEQDFKLKKLNFKPRLNFNGREGGEVKRAELQDKFEIWMNIDISDADRLLFPYYKIITIKTEGITTTLVCSDAVSEYIGYHYPTSFYEKVKESSRVFFEHPIFHKDNEVFLKEQGILSRYLHLSFSLID